MEIEEADLPSYSVREQVEFLSRQLPFLPMVFRTEVAVEIASIRDFYIATIYHNLFFQLQKYNKYP